MQEEHILKDHVRYFLSLVLLACCASFCFAQNARVKNDRDKGGLLGPVKSIEFGRIEYTLKGGKAVEGKRVLQHTTTFNEQGNTSKVINYKEDGSVSAKQTHNYDSRGRNIGSEGCYVMQSEGAEKTYKQKQVFTLDDQGNQIESIGFQTDGTLSHRHVFKFDADGHKLEELFYSWNGTRAGKIIYTYDERGNQLTQVSYNADDSVNYKMVNSYDAVGDRIESVQYHGDTLRYKMLYKYDDRRRLTEQETFEYNASSNGRASHAPEPGKIVYAYTDETKTTEVATYDQHGSLREKVIRNLDNKGNEIGSEMYNADGSLKATEIRWYDKNKLLRVLSGKSLRKFEYDAQGNWTRQTYLIQPKDSDTPEAFGAEYRIITYY